MTEEEDADLQDMAVRVKMSSQGVGVRMVTHADVSLEDTQLAIRKLQYVINEIDKRR